MKKINIAQIGVGYWGPNILRNLDSNNLFNIRRVVDLSDERIEFVKTNYPYVSVSKNIDDIINDEVIDAVVVSTPAGTHFDLAKKCLEANKHILVEKPMALNVKDIKILSKLSQKKNLVAMVGHTFIYNSAVRCVKSIIDSGEIGKIRYIYSQRLNLGRIRSDIDVLWNLAPHDISIIQFWLDEMDPLSIQRRGQSYVQKGIDDVVFLNIKYPNEIMANIHVSWLDPQKVRKMIVVGSEKMIIYDDMAETKVTVCDKGIDIMSNLGENMDYDKNIYPNFNHRNGDFYYPDFVWIEPLKAEIDHFAECILSNKKSFTDTFHAEKVIRILSEEADAN